MLRIFIEQVKTNVDEEELDRVYRFGKVTVRWSYLSERWVVQDGVVVSGVKDTAKEAVQFAKSISGLNEENDDAFYIPDPLPLNIADAGGTPEQLQNAKTPALAPSSSASVDFEDQAPPPSISGGDSLGSPEPQAPALEPPSSPPIPTPASAPSMGEPTPPSTT